MPFMDYVVVKIGGRQYWLSQGEIFLVNRLAGKPGDKIKLDQVLLTVAGDKVKLGRPLLKGVTVEAQLMEQIKGSKIRVAKFKSKSRYRRVRGHRQLLSRLKLVKI